MFVVLSTIGIGKYEEIEYCWLHGGGGYQIYRTALFPLAADAFFRPDKLLLMVTPEAHAVSVPVKMLEEWLLRVGGMIYGAESGDILRKVSSGIYLVQGEGIGRIYSRRTGFMPPDLEAAGDGVDDW